MIGLSFCSIIVSWFTACWSRDHCFTVWAHSCHCIVHIQFTSGQWVIHPLSLWRKTCFGAFCSQFVGFFKPCIKNKNQDVQLRVFTLERLHSWPAATCVFLALRRFPVALHELQSVMLGLVLQWEKTFTMTVAAFKAHLLALCFLSRSLHIQNTFLSWEMSQPLLSHVSQQETETTELLSLWHSSLKRQFHFKCLNRKLTLSIWILIGHNSAALFYSTSMRTSPSGFTLNILWRFVLACWHWTLCSPFASRFTVLFFIYRPNSLVVNVRHRASQKYRSLSFPTR